MELSDVLICSALISLTVGMLSLATFGSIMFLFCSYAGTISLVAGFLVKVGLIPKRLMSKGLVIVVMLFASALFFVTGVNMLFIDVKVHAQPTRFAFSNANKLCLTIIRPYAFFSLPMMEAGVIIFIAALTILFFDGV